MNGWCKCRGCGMRMSLKKAYKAIELTKTGKEIVTYWCCEEEYNELRGEKDGMCRKMSDM